MALHIKRNLSITLITQFTIRELKTGHLKSVRRYGLFKRFLYFSVFLLTFCNPVLHDCFGAACIETEKGTV